MSAAKENDIIRILPSGTETSVGAAWTLRGDIKNRLWLDIIEWPWSRKPNSGRTVYYIIINESISSTEHGVTSLIQKKVLAMLKLV